MTSARRSTPRVSVLEVLLQDTAVGVLTLLPGDASVFTFAEDYLNNTDRPTLSLSFKTSSGDIRAPSRLTRRKVPPFFSNLLPEGHLRGYLAERANVNPEREFFLLWLLGEDLPGAATIRPAPGEVPPPAESDEVTTEPSLATAMRFSLAGVQLKFSAIAESSCGLTIPARGLGGSWILKLPSARFDSVPENEYVMLELARAAGIDVPDTRLVPADEVLGLPNDVRLSGNSLAVRRFDRAEEGQRIHTEDFAQVFHVFPNRKYQRASYQNIAAVLWAEVGLAGVVQFTRRLAFSALIGNADMHLKNWSLIYRDGRTPELAPAYDFVSTIPYISDQEMALSLAGTKAMSDVSLDLFRRFAATAGVPEGPVVDAARETAQRLMAAWSDGEMVGMLPRWIRDEISLHLQTVPLSARG